MKHGHDLDGERLPIKVDSTSNGEFVPIPLPTIQREANRLARQQAAENAKRVGMGRRAFLVSACGAASTLLAFNAVNAAAGRWGGAFELTAEAAVDPEAAAAALGGEEFIFDVQGHFIGEAALRPGSPRGPKNFIKDVFLDSDTDMMVLSFVPSRRDSEPLTIREADAVRQIVDDLEGSHRLLLHGRVNPNQAGDVEGMGRTGRALGRCRLEDLHAVGAGRPGLLSVRSRHRRSVHREGAQPGRQGHLHPQGHPVRRAVVRAQPVRRRRRGSQALPGREFHHLPLGLGAGTAGTRPTSRTPDGTALTHWFARCWTTACRRTATSTPNSAAPGEA